MLEWGTKWLLPPASVLRSWATHPTPHAPLPCSLARQTMRHLCLLLTIWRTNKAITCTCALQFGTPEQDAERRDFTINSMFFNINSGDVEDFTSK